MRSYSLRCAVGALTVFALLGAVLLAIGHKDYPDLHTILDTGMALLSAMLAMLLWDMGQRLGRPFPRRLAISFAVTSALEIIHVLVTIEWSGPLAAIAASAHFLRPATWPPAAHTLPIGIAWTLWLLRRDGNAVLPFAVVMTGAAAGLAVAFQYLPTYTPPTFLGISRPVLIAPPLLWLVVTATLFRLREADRLMQPLTWMAAALFVANTVMLYSQAPADPAAMVAHLGKVCGYLALLLSLMQLASTDMIERIRAEAALARLNEDLERQVAERTAALRESEQLARGIVETAPDAVVQMTESGTIAAWNPQAEAVLGWTRDEALGKPLADLIVPPEHRAAHREGLTRFLDTGVNTILGERIEMNALRRDGQQIKVELSITALRRQEGYTFNGFIRDLTQKNVIEEQLRQAQKMEAIGNLTGGMAHDFNNLLGVIIGNLDLLRTDTALDAAADELAGDAIDAAMRGADLTRRLLAFARRQPLQPERTDVNELVTGIVSLLRRTLGENIDISLDLGSDLWPVVVDRAQLESALVNLATNARDAMPRGGQLTIATANRHLDADYAAQHADLSVGDYALIEVSDSGTGIPPDAMSRIFEPFFTTKQLGQGTGLGLSMVFGFMKQSDGHINVYSEPGAGTTFRLYLPRVQEDDPQIRTADPVVTGAIRGSESILLVEDNDAMRRVVRRQLTELGYRVSEADRAAAALDMLLREDFDLLFTDIVMPGEMSGFDLAREAMAHRPALKVLLTSGFPEATLNGSGGAISGRHLLSKPYRRDELARALREILDAKPKQPR